MKTVQRVAILSAALALTAGAAFAQTGTRPGTTRMPGQPLPPATSPSTQPPAASPPTAPPSEPRDPASGLPTTGPRIDPRTGQPVPPGMTVDPNTGQVTPLPR